MDPRYVAGFGDDAADADARVRQQYAKSYGTSLPANTFDQGLQNLMGAAGTAAAPYVQAGAQAAAPSVQQAAQTFGQAVTPTIASVSEAQGRAASKGFFDSWPVKVAAGIALVGVALLGVSALKGSSR